MDERLRDSERGAATGDAEARARLLQEHLRGGRTNTEGLRLAARLGDPAARLLMGQIGGLDLDHPELKQRRDALRRAAAQGLLLPQGAWDGSDAPALLGALAALCGATALAARLLDLAETIDCPGCGEKVCGVDVLDA